jgi:hypothetical protein
VTEQDRRTRAVAPHADALNDFLAVVDEAAQFGRGLDGVLDELRRFRQAAARHEHDGQHAAGKQGNESGAEGGAGCSLQVLENSLVT